MYLQVLKVAKTIGNNDEVYLLFDLMDQNIYKFNQPGCLRILSLKSSTNFHCSFFFTGPFLSTPENTFHLPNYSFTSCITSFVSSNALFFVL